MSAGDGKVTCDPEMMRDHESRITENTKDVERVDQRINGVVELIKDFTVEMRESNKNVGALVGEVKALTNEVKHVVEATNKNTNEIEEIKDNMTYKDAVLDIYKTIEKSNEKHEKGMDAIMTELRNQDSKTEELEQALTDHRNEPYKEAYDNTKEFKKWLFYGFGGLIFSILGLIATLIITNFFG